MNLLKFCIAVTLAAIPCLSLLLFGLLIMLLRIDKIKGKLLMYQADVAMATMIYGTEQRTLSGICGAYSKAGKGHYRVIANFIDMLASLFGDAPNHCNRADDWEIENNLDY